MAIGNLNDTTNKYKKKLSGINNDSTSLGSTKSDAETTIPDDFVFPSGMPSSEYQNYYNAVTGGGLVDTMGNDLSGDTETPTSSTSSTMQTITDMINAKTKNSKAELQSALQRANAASSNYLKALGLNNSGAGMSQLTDIATQYQNALSTVNQNAQTEVNTDLTNTLNEMLSNGSSYSDVEDYIDKYGNDTGNTNYWTQLAKSAGKTWDSDQSLVLEDLQNMYDGSTGDDFDYSSLTSAQKEKAKELYNDIASAENSTDYADKVQAYQDFVNEVSGNDITDTSSSSNTSEFTSNNTKWIKDTNTIKESDLGEKVNLETANTSSFGKYLGTNSANGPDSKQNQYVYTIIEAAKNGLIPEGAIINFNRGQNLNKAKNSCYIYYNGNFYKCKNMVNNYKWNYLNSGNRDVWKKLLNTDSLPW